MPGLVNPLVNSGAVKLDPSDVSFYQPSYQLLKASPNTPVLGVSFSSLIVIVRGIVNLSSPPVNLEVNPTRRCKIKYARGVSREHIRNFPVKSVKFANSKDFRFQDFKDFTKDFRNELRDFKLVADPSDLSNCKGKGCTKRHECLYKGTSQILHTYTYIRTPTNIHTPTNYV